ncbi:polynucleotide 5'-hydroxyl-kinase NDAI_0D04900 [Naumovozyma dairenensis CBS 421]|uniref:Polynucleotide 5'-hydroxyl-kinase GRC3 n=1 Tax=Naumovozyma dairenensis (strain ATCC 10597 / BCRC 20456 / CBS 421 / NBRC 0211 / NRRL Y-12639) TaxID=1071378 RepID=G0WAJ2_NAUDC|nr:hypothetical protein NDAI_0D04900 [Naumovozyma dairenensis CBS 421]CCD24803.1 hypothetical protein NDAI_0D04900 [Naumovozyma dairenensis CBS 421]
MKETLPTDGIPRYDKSAVNSDSDTNSDSDQDIDSTTSLSTATVTPQPINIQLQNEEYDSDTEVSSIVPNGQSCMGDNSSVFHPLLNHNVFQIIENNDNSTIFIGLTSKQILFLSGIFTLQIVKGGMVYNNVHYNASLEKMDFWHPLSNSIPSIQGSHYAGWSNKLHVLSRYEHFLLEETKLNDFPCILQLNNMKIDGLLDCHKLYPDVRYLWKLRSFQTDEMFQRLPTDKMFDILVEGIDLFTPLKISNEWQTTIEKISLSHRNFEYDSRIMIIGGKNSGKSTFLRLLIEKILSNKESTDNKINHNIDSNDLLYLDMDPGQPEYSHPESISLSQLNGSKKVLGQHLCQSTSFFLKQIYLGVTSPQDEPTTYLKQIDHLVTTFEELYSRNTSVINLPGWIKGFGITVLNKIIAKYKPTNVIILESNSSSQNIDDLKIPDEFTRESFKYNPIITKIPANFNFMANQQQQQKLMKFHASQLRTFKMVALFHKTLESSSRISYDFNPLLNKCPLQISFGLPIGGGGLQAIKISNEFKTIHEDDLPNALEGTIMALHSCDNGKSLKDLIIMKGHLPVITNNNFNSLEYVSLVLIHSVDVQNKILNVYVPEYLIPELDCGNPEINWVLVRGKSETPLCEIYQRNNIFAKVALPFISKERRKKYEHIWKIRRNVKRRGHHMK